MILDDDVFFGPTTRLDTMLAVLEAKPDIQLVAGAYAQYNSYEVRPVCRLDAIWGSWLHRSTTVRPLLHVAYMAGCYGGQRLFAAV